MFDAPVVLTFDDNPYINVEAPTNAPPTAPKVAVQPTVAKAGDALLCAIVTASYDLDPVTYHYRWFRDGLFVPAVGDPAAVPEGVTLAGEVWLCRAWATDGIERSKPSEAQLTVTP